MDAFDALVDLVPPRPPSPPPRSPSPHVVAPFIDLPDELLRKIFEIGVVSDYYTARNLMNVSKWVRAWLVDTYHDAVVVATRAQLRTLEKQPYQLLAKAQSLWIGLPLQRLELGHVFQPLERMPNVTRLAVVQVSRYKYPSSKRLEELLHPNVRLREFMVANAPRESYFWDYRPSVTFSSPVFSTITHLRLGHLSTNLVDQLSSSDTPALPFLTHLSFDAYVYPWWVTNTAYETERPIRAYRRILEAPCRVRMQMLVLVVFHDMELHTSKLLSLRLPRLVVLREYKGYTRRGDWLATSKGESGFWERAARNGRTGIS